LLPSRHFCEGKRYDISPSPFTGLGFYYSFLWIAFTGLFKYSRLAFVRNFKLKCDKKNYSSQKCRDIKNQLNVIAFEGEFFIVEIYQ